MQKVLDKKPEHAPQTSAPQQDQESGLKSLAPPPFALQSSPVQAKQAPVQRQEAQTQESTYEVTRGELTSIGEGSDAQTSHIHRPNTPSSGVTLGKGYDIGSRTAEQVITELTAAGMSVDQATKISAGAGLTGAPADTFIAQNKDSVGEISRDVQYALLGQMLEVYTDRAKSTATSTTADSGNRNAAGREAKEGAAPGTYVMSEIQWDNLHPAMVELLTDLIYQGGYYGYNRVARINEVLIANDGDQLAQFKGVLTLFDAGGVMDTYAEAIGEGKSGAGSSETWFGQETDFGGRFRRNAIRRAYLNAVITALESGQTVVVNEGAETGGNTGETQNQPQVAPTPELPSGAQTTKATKEVTQSSGFEYTVQPGESLYKLAKKHGVSIEALKSANGDKLKTWGSVVGFDAGATIIVPKAAAKEEKTPAAAKETTSPDKETAPEESGVDYGAIAETIFKALSGSWTGWGAIVNAVTSLGGASAIGAVMKAYKSSFGKDMIAHIKAVLSKSWFGGVLGTVLEYLNVDAPADQGKQEVQTPQEEAEKAKEEAEKDKAPAAEEKTETNEPYSEFTYASQRDNEFKESNVFEKKVSTIKADNMCNVTTLAMQLMQLADNDAELKLAAAQLYLDKGGSGDKAELAQKQLEDLLMMIFKQLGDDYFKEKVGIAPNSDYGPHQFASGLNHVASLFTAYVGGTKHLSSITTQAKYDTHVKPSLDKGSAVMLSTKLTGGHIIQLVDIKGDGLIVNDPYGMRMPGGYVKNGSSVKSYGSRMSGKKDTFERRTKHNSGLKDGLDTKLEANTGNFNHTLGELNFYSWEEVTTYKIGKWLNIVDKK